MIHFFGNVATKLCAVDTSGELTAEDERKLVWLFGDKPRLSNEAISGPFIGPRASMVTPWSTNAVEITQNMGIQGILRMEEFQPGEGASFDPMLAQKYDGLGQEIFTISASPEPIRQIDNISDYNQKEGLSLSTEEVQYLEDLSKKIGRKLTDSEVFGFSQVNSEHCRHKIFNGTFVIDGKEMPDSLFALIKETSQVNPGGIISAYKDNVAFIKGPKVQQFAPEALDRPDSYKTKSFDSVISLKAETHNFPTTVEPFNGAATGSGGEIRDRMAGGQGSIPLAGTAVYMTPYSRLTKNRSWEEGMAERKWLYQTPLEILIKASNGASDFANKFGQPLVAGSVLTFEHQEENRKLGYDKVIMLAGGVGVGKKSQSKKVPPKVTDRIVMMGGDNYQIGMGGAAVSSADTGEFSSSIELNAVQRSNPEMQKRVANVVRTMVENDENQIRSIHDHGAGGHLNCFSELVEDSGGTIDVTRLPIGDPTLSMKEIMGNESQERMGLVVDRKDVETLERIAERERAPIYDVGEVTGDQRFVVESSKEGEKPIDLALSDLFGSSPKTILNDRAKPSSYSEIRYDSSKIQTYIESLLQLEAVACKDWLTNKVDRCVSGRVAKQPCVGPLQLPLNNVGVVALDYEGKEGVATSIGHAPAAGLISAAAGSRNSIAEALTNLLWAPLGKGLSGVSLSANWMWPCKTPGEDARLYEAVKACSNFAIELGINIPTGKDSLSMKQKYSDGDVIAPGTVIISASAHCDEIANVVEPMFQPGKGSIYYINFSQDRFQLGGSSFGQIQNGIGGKAPSIQDSKFFKNAFASIQSLVRERKIAAGHDVSSGGLVTTLLELCFATPNIGAEVNLTALGESDFAKVLFSENAGIVFQTDESVEAVLSTDGVEYFKIGSVKEGTRLALTNHDVSLDLDISTLRDLWFQTSYLLDQKQSGSVSAESRFSNYKNQPLNYAFPAEFNGKRPSLLKSKIKAAVLREKGSNSEREMANALALAGFDVIDVHMTDLMSGRENLENIRFIGAVGGFSNSDVLGSAKGWAGAFKYNDRARTALESYFRRDDTLSFGACNGCQLFVELGLIYPGHSDQVRMLHNDSGKFECIFTSVEIQPNESVMLGSMAGQRLGIWAAHGEGKFAFPHEESKYRIVGKYGYEGYPSNPNGSGFNAAMIVSDDGRHLASMPHFERSIFPWNWGYYPRDRSDEVTPWIEAFLNARRWLEG